MDYLTYRLELAYTNIVNLLTDAVNFIEPAFSHFDPALLQNVILAILAIFIPYGIVFLTNALEKNNPRNDFARLVINDEVFELKKLFTLTVSSIVFLTFFSGVDTPVIAKITALFISGFIFFKLQKSYWKMVRYSEDRNSFDLIFLEKLSVKNGKSLNNQKVITAWQGAFSETIEPNEFKHIELFVKKVDEAIKNECFDEALKLVSIYIESIDKRYLFLAASEVLPSLLEWNKTLHTKQFVKINSYKRRNDVHPKLKQILDRFSKDKGERFWNWNYFENDALKKLVPNILKQGDGYQLFTTLKQHLEKEVSEWEEELDTDKKKEQIRYIEGLVTNFTDIYFETISKISDNHSVWEHYFPPEWKVTPSNYDNVVARIFANKFIEWSRDKLFAHRKEKYANRLSNVIDNLFPNIKGSLFRGFLRKFHYIETEAAITAYQNFSIISAYQFYFGEPLDEGQRVKQVEQAKTEATKETLEIITKYFHYWHFLKPNRDDLTDDEFEKWDTMPKDEQKAKVKEIRLGRIRSEIQKLKSAAIVEKVAEQERYKYAQDDLIELMEELKNFLELS